MCGVGAMGKQVLNKFGPFFILDKIAEGGMAEVFRARPANAESNGRIFVVKRILPHIADDAQFIRMFKAETHVCMGFNHPNTIQIYDFGEVDFIPYLSMEYVEGQSVAQLTRKIFELSRPLPITASVGVAFLASSGLDYVHNYKNKATGEELHVIHRDISPQNILVSYEGSVKLIDFGVAKASVDNPDKTMAGTMKGKASYFSPEQARGAELDARSDIFSLGIVLWEMLTGRRLFYRADRNTLSLLESIRNLDVTIPAPSRLNPAIPPLLDEWVLKALQKDPDKRISTALEFKRGLEMVLHELGQKSVGPHLASLMSLVFSNEIEQDREELKRLNHQAQQFITHEENSKWFEPTSATNCPPPQSLTLPSLKPAPTPVSGFQAPVAVSPPLSQLSEIPEPPDPRRNIISYTFTGILMCIALMILFKPESNFTQGLFQIVKITTDGIQKIWSNPEPSKSRFALSDSVSSNPARKKASNKKAKSSK